MFIDESAELERLRQRGLDVERGIAICERLSSDWKFNVRGLLAGATNCLVAIGMDSEGREVVLRVPLSQDELVSGYHAQLAFSGRGGAPIFAHEAETGSTLMARLLPGTMLLDVGKSPAREVVACCTVIRKLDQPSIPEAVAVEDWYEPFLAVNEAEGIPSEMLLDAQRTASQLLSSTERPRLLHGDLHHFNLLLHGDEWFAIDPHGVNGDPAMEPAAFLRNPSASILDQANPVGLMDIRIRTFAECLGISATRIWQWGVAHNVLSAWWDPPKDRAPTIEVVRAIIQAKP